MRINELVFESKTDEGLASAIGSGVGALSKGVGAVAGGVHGAWDKMKQGYNSGRAGVNGTAPATSTGGTSSSSGSTPATSIGGAVSQSARAASQSTQAASQPTQAVSPEVLQKSIQNLKGSDIERIRNMLKQRAGITESSELDEISIGAIAQGAKRLATGAGSAVKSAYNAAKPAVGAAVNAAGRAVKAAPAALGKAAGSVRGAITTAKGAYQQAAGGSLTPQELDRAIATLPKDQAIELLQFFNTIHIAAPASVPAGKSNAVNTTHPADDNPNLVPGTNESVGYSRYLGMHL
jgi:hypothetical protein